MNETQHARYLGLHWLLDRLQTRSRRRSLAAFYIGVLGLFMLVTAFIDNNWLAAPFMVLFMSGTVLLHGSVRGMADASSQDLDERQIALRNAGYRYTYWAGVTVAFLGGLFVAEISDWDTAFEIGLFIAVWGAVTGLPALFLAWTLPSEAPDEEE